MIDILGAVRAQRGNPPRPRRGSDASIHAIGYLIVAPDPVTYLCTVSVNDSEPIAGVPATSMDYTDITAVHVLLDPSNGRPVHVLGPAGELPFVNIPFTTAGETEVVTGRVIPPTSTGTYREDEAAWDRYSTTTFGGVSDMWQQASANMIPNPDPQGEWETYFSAPYESAPVAGTGWSCTVDAGSLSSNMLTNWNVPTDGDSSFWADVNVAKANFTIYPVPSGTDAVAVTAATAYDFGCKVAVGWWGTLPSAQIKVDWYDAAGDLLSSSSGSDAALAEYPGAGTWYNMPDDYLLSSAGFCEADPTATLTSPAGAAFARPSVYVHSTSTALDDVYVAQFSMGVG